MSVNKFNRHNNKNLCKVTPIKNGFHELHKEKDQIRDIVFNQIDNFYQKFRE